MEKLDSVINLAEAISAARKEYKYQPQLTKKLDSHTGEFSEQTLLEIALWKTNRYPTITPALLSDINELRNNYSEKKQKCYFGSYLKKNREVLTCRWHLPY